MIAIRFRVQSKQEKADELAAAFEAVVAPSRQIEGVISFDIARAVDDPNVFIATEVFEDSAARERQEALPEVATVMNLLPDCLAGAPEATLFHISSTESAM